jgi:hypothetical protein
MVEVMDAMCSRPSFLFLHFYSCSLPSGLCQPAQVTNEAYHVILATSISVNRMARPRGGGGGWVGGKTGTYAARGERTSCRVIWRLSIHWGGGGSAFR